MVIKKSVIALFMVGLGWSVLCSAAAGGGAVAMAVPEEDFLTRFGVQAAAIAPCDLLRIAHRILRNNLGTNSEHIVFWGEHNAYYNLGIMHALGYGHETELRPYAEQATALCQWLRINVAQGFPVWLESSDAQEVRLSWRNRAEFLSDTRLDELRLFLHTTYDAQVGYMFHQLMNTLPLIFVQVDDATKLKIQTCLLWLSSTPQGMYALLDYNMFKGTGLDPAEQKNGQGWGLFQVLQAMPDGLTQENVTTVFMLTAADVLVGLLKKSGPEYENAKYLQGWMTRVATYIQPL